MNSSEQPTTTPANALSVVTALSDAFTYVLQGFKAFVALAWKWLVTVIIIAAGFFGLIGWLAKYENELLIHFAIGGGLLTAFLFSVAYYILIVRNWWFAETQPPIFRLYPKFLFRVVILSLAVIAVISAFFLPTFGIGIIVFSFFAGDAAEPPFWLVALAILALIVVVLATLIFTIYVAGRLCPWLIATAVEKPLSLRQSWTITRGAGMRIMGGMIAVTLAFSIIDISIETALSPLLGVRSDAFDLLYRGEALIALFVLLLLKIAVYFVQTAAAMVYCASIYRQASGG